MKENANDLHVLYSLIALVLTILFLITLVYLTGTPFDNILSWFEYHWILSTVLMLIISFIICGATGVLDVN